LEATLGRKSNYQGRVERELHAMKKLYQCPTCNSNTRFLRDHITKLEEEKSRLIRLNQDLIREVEDLHNSIGDMRSKLDRAERGGFQPFSQDQSRIQLDWYADYKVRRERWMTEDQKKLSLLRPNRHN
jgi:predicted nuclease with TOPRIM domain